MIWSRWRRRSTHPPVAAELPPEPALPASPPPSEPAPWHPLARQFASRVLMLAWSAGSYLAEVENAEQDPVQLQRLYRTDHALTRIRRAAENLQVLAGMRVEDPDRQVTTLLDVIRAATSAVESYDRVHIVRTAELAVSEVAADDVIRVLTELIDNAVRFSQPTLPVTVSAHLTDAGHVLVRVEDSGIGVDATELPRLNAMLDGTTDAVMSDEDATRLGLLVVACLTRTHRSLRVQLSPRQPAGTVAMLLIGPDLVCEIPHVTLPSQVRRAGSPSAAARAGLARTVPARPAIPRQPGPRPDGIHYQRAGADVTAVLPIVTSPAVSAPMPRRVPGSVRSIHTRSSVVPRPAPPQRPWSDDAADFAAGVDDARS